MKRQAQSRSKQVIATTNIWWIAGRIFPGDTPYKSLDPVTEQKNAEKWVIFQRAKPQNPRVMGLF